VALIYFPTKETFFNESQFHGKWTKWNFYYQWNWGKKKGGGGGGGGEIIFWHLDEPVVSKDKCLQDPSSSPKLDFQKYMAWPNKLQNIFSSCLNGLEAFLGLNNCAFPWKQTKTFKFLCRTSEPLDGTIIYHGVGNFFFLTSCLLFCPEPGLKSGTFFCLGREKKFQRFFLSILLPTLSTLPPTCFGFSLKKYKDFSTFLPTSDSHKCIFQLCPPNFAIHISVFFNFVSHIDIFFPCIFYVCF